MPAKIIMSEADRLATLLRSERKTAGLVQRQLTTIIEYRDREIAVLRDQLRESHEMYVKAVAELLRRKQ